MSAADNISRSNAFGPQRQGRSYGGGAPDPWPGPKREVRDTTGNILRPGMAGYETQLAKQSPETSGRWVTINGHHVHIGGKGGLVKHESPHNIVPAGSNFGNTIPAAKRIYRTPAQEKHIAKYAALRKARRM